jgi:hypothetical protein
MKWRRKEGDVEGEGGLPVEWPPSSPNFLSSDTLKSNLTNPSLYQSPPPNIWSHSGSPLLFAYIHSKFSTLCVSVFSSLHQSVCELSGYHFLQLLLSTPLTAVCIFYLVHPGKYLTFISIQVLQSSCSAQIILLNPVNPVYHS